MNTKDIAYLTADIIIQIIASGGKLQMKLKPCPFCGSTKLKIDKKSKPVHYKNICYVTVSVRCNCCHGRGGTVSGEIRGGLAAAPISDNLTTYDNLRIKAVEAWNRRTENE